MSYFETAKGRRRGRLVAGLALLLAGCAGSSSGGPRSACGNGFLLVRGECAEVVDGSCPNPVGLFRDSDGDGFGKTSDVVGGCVVEGYVEAADDCNDEDASVRPGAPEQCNSIDDDCDGAIDNDVVERAWFEDEDGDGFGVAESTRTACRVPDGFAELAGDCNDADVRTNPGADDTCDGVDRDCNGVIDDGSSARCEAGETLGCTTECGSRGTALCDGACGAGPCVPPEDTCNFVDDDCDGLVDQGVSALVEAGRSTFVPAFGAVAKDAAIVALDDALVTLVLMASDFNQYVVAHKFEAGTGRELASSVVAGRLGPDASFDQRLHAVRVGDNVVVAPPATMDGFELYLLSGETLEELEREDAGTAPTGMRWAAQCLAARGSVVAWGRRALGENMAEEALPPSTENRTVVRFLTGQLTLSAEHTVTEFEQNLGNRYCALASPVGSEAVWPLAYQRRNGVRLAFVSASGGEQAGLRTDVATLGPSEVLEGLHATADGGNGTVLAYRVGEGVSLVRYQVGDVATEAGRREDAIVGVASPLGGVSTSGGRLFVAAQSTRVLTLSTFDTIQALGGDASGGEPLGIVRQPAAAAVVELPVVVGGEQPVVAHEVACGGG